MGGGGGGSQVGGWVGGRGHAAQIRPTPVPICGPRSPLESEKKGTKQGGREVAAGGEKERKGGVDGVAAGQGKKKGRGRLGFWERRERIGVHIILLLNGLLAQLRPPHVHPDSSRPFRFHWSALLKAVPYCFGDQIQVCDHTDQRQLVLKAASYCSGETQISSTS
uniref:Uncharacterized protein n=1 Tax=Fagus sylvatica TaxID=28930 RepID=A0A2N9IFY8_FAGSY